MVNSDINNIYIIKLLSVIFIPGGQPSGRWAGIFTVPLGPGRTSGEIHADGEWMFRNRLQFSRHPARTSLLIIALKYHNLSMYTTHNSLNNSD